MPRVVPFDAVALPRRVPPRGNPVPAVSLLHLPNDVLRLVLGFADARSLAACEVVCRALGEPSRDKALWHHVLRTDFANSRRSLPTLAPVDMDPQGLYRQRILAIRKQRDDIAQRVAETQAAEEYQQRGLRASLALGVWVAMPVQLLAVWAPFLFLLFLCLKLDGKINWSWWAVLAPAYCALYLLAAGAAGVTYLRRYRPAGLLSLFNSHPMCILPISKAFSRKVHTSGVRLLATALALLVVLALATWFVTIAMKMDGVWDSRWSVVSFPAWLFLVALALFGAVSILGNVKPVYGWLSLVMLVVLSTLIPPLVVHAEGSRVKNPVGVFIPEWLVFGGMVTTAVQVCCCKAMKCRRRSLVKGCGLLVAAVTVSAPVLVPIRIFAENYAKPGRFAQTTVYGVPMAMLAVLAVAGTVYLVHFARRYRRRLQQGSGPRRSQLPALPALPDAAAPPV